MSSARLIQGDALEVLRGMDAESVNCCITSPPYWGLRDYGTSQWIDGRDDCDHSESRPSRRAASVASSGLDGGKATVHASHQFKGDCGHCGARRIDAQLGLEPTPEAYVSRLVEVFHEVRRVLKRDGTAWINLGDSYAANTKGSGGKANSTLNAQRDDAGVVIGKSIVTFEPRQFDLSACALKPKDLVGIPWRVAFALQADGWYLRSDIIWSKPNPMPESVTDRPTKAHEYLFLLSKSERYYYDAAAIAEDASVAMIQQMKQGYNGTGTKDYESAGVQNPSSVKARIIAGKAATSPRHDGNTWNENNGRGFIPSGVTRNRRTVWTIATEPYPGAHFAVMPEALVDPCVKAGCPRDGTVIDPFCGSGTVGVVALRHDRNFIGLDLNPAYLDLARARIYPVTAPLFGEVTA